MPSAPVAVRVTLHESLLRYVAIDLRILELPREPSLTMARLIAAGQRPDEHGADVLLTGCADMAPFRLQSQEARGFPVSEPAYAAVSVPLGASLLGQTLVDRTVRRERGRLSR